MRYLYVKYQNPISYGSKDIAKVKIFKTRSKFKVTKSKVLLPNEQSLHEVSIYVKYQNPISYGSKDIAKIKVFDIAHVKVFQN